MDISSYGNAPVFFVGLIIGCFIGLLLGAVVTIIAMAVRKV